MRAGHIAGMLVGVVLLGVVAYLPLRSKPEQINDLEDILQNESVQEDPSKEVTIKQESEPPKSSFTVVPTLGLDELIKDFEDEVIEDAEHAILIAQFRQQMMSWKAKGGPKYCTDDWMQEPAYYEKLTTEDLVEECFAQPVFASVATCTDPERVFIRLKIFHNGFAELFKRDDMWQGVLHAYEILASQLNSESDFRTAFRAASHLSAIKILYSYEPFKEQLKGREEVFMSANLEVLRSFQTYMRTFDPESMGLAANELPPFFCEPCTVANVALMLLKQTDPVSFSRIIPEISSVRFPQEQRKEDLVNYIDLVIEKLDGVITEKE